MTIAKCFKRAVVPAVVIVCSAGPVVAADAGPYVTADLGWAFTPQSVGWRLSPTNELTGSGYHDPDVAWTLAAGYRFNRYFGVEAGYVDLGRFTGSISDRSGLTNGLAELSSSHKGETLAAVGTLPFGQWEAYLKAGALRADSQVRVTGSEGTSAIEDGASTHTVHGFFGVGLGYNFDAHWRAQFGLTDYVDVGGSRRVGINGPNIRVLGVGISYRF
jgi:OmpA-OmpF porin, OOP family